MVEEKTLWNGIEEYLKSNNIDFSRQKYFSSWPVIAGVRLSSCTRLDSFDLKKGKIYVKANSLSSRSLLIMEKTRIIKDWNSFFKDAPIKEIVVVKGY